MPMRLVVPQWYRRQPCASVAISARRTCTIGVAATARSAAKRSAIGSADVTGVSGVAGEPRPRDRPVADRHPHKTHPPGSSRRRARLVDPDESGPPTPTGDRATGDRLPRCRRDRSDDRPGRHPTGATHRSSTWCSKHCFKRAFPYFRNAVSSPPAPGRRGRLRRQPSLAIAARRPCWLPVRVPGAEGEESRSLWP